MSATELWTSRSIVEETQGVSGIRIFRAPYDTWQSDCPKLGSVFPGYTKLKLKRRQIDMLTPDAAGTAPADVVKVTCEYSTFQFIEDKPEEEYSVSGEVLEMGLGRRWLSTGRVCQQALGAVFPLIDWKLKLVVAKVPKVDLIREEGKVNGYSWQGFREGTLLFQGAEAQSRYDYERQRYIYAMTLHFTFRAQPWNYQWRAAEQLRVDGSLVYADDGQPVLVEGPASVGGWDMMEPRLYGWGDFDPLIGLPRRYFANPT